MTNVSWQKPWGPCQRVQPVTLVGSDDSIALGGFGKSTPQILWTSGNPEYPDAVYSPASAGPKYSTLIESMTLKAHKAGSGAVPAFPLNLIFFYGDPGIAATTTTLSDPQHEAIAAIVPVYLSDWRCNDGVFANAYIPLEIELEPLTGIYLGIQLDAGAPMALNDVGADNERIFGTLRYRART